MTASDLRKIHLLIDNVFDEIIKSNKIDEKLFAYKQEKLKTELTSRFGEKAAFHFSETFLKSTINYAVWYYFMGKLAMVYIELHAVLERSVILIFPSLLTGTLDATKENQAIGKFIEKKQLLDFVESLLILKIWDNEDKKKVLKLNKKRNGIAHHNPELVSNQFNNGQYINSALINTIVEKDKNTHIAIVDVVELLYKLVSGN